MKFYRVGDGWALANRHFKLLWCKRRLILYFGALLADVMYFSNNSSETVTRREWSGYRKSTTLWKPRTGKDRGQKQHH